MQEAKVQEAKVKEVAKAREAQLIEVKYLSENKDFEDNEDDEEFEDANDGYEDVVKSKENKKSIPFTSGLPISDPIDPKIIENYRVRQAISIASRQQSKNVSNSPFEEYLKKNKNL